MGKDDPAEQPEDFTHGIMIGIPIQVRHYRQSANNHET